MIQKNKWITPESAEIFLVYDALKTGGIETLILRLADYLVSLGFLISIYCKPDGELQPSVNKKVNVINYRDVPDLLSRIKNDARRDYVGGRVLVLSFDSTPAARALMVEMSLPKVVQVFQISGVFHPKSYFMSGQPRDRIFLNELLVHAIGESNIFFMNEECKASHEKKWHRDLSLSPVIPLPITPQQSMWQPSAGHSVRIASVGRLVDFKAYNLGAARIVKSCQDRGVAVSWDIFGYGPLEAEIKAMASELGVDQSIRLVGRLDYADFSATVAGYDLFVGMGTAVIEAAMVGVPSICAVVDEQSQSYGYVSDLPFGNVGEVIEGRSMKEIDDLICAYALLSAEDRLQLSQKEVVSARRYGMPLFVESLFKMTDTYKPPMNRIGRFFIAKIFYLMTEGPVAKALFGRGLKTKFVKLFR